MTEQTWLWIGFNAFVAALLAVASLLQPKTARTMLVTDKSPLQHETNFHPNFTH